MFLNQMEHSTDLHLFVHVMVLTYVNWVTNVGTSPLLYLNLIIFQF